ncbi:LysR family transcriptional regulator [Komagataeibacter melaceti]|uniref:LysR family transcriptional regulator n=2 Tax=Komagataeibacter melaceti TaxID=2766577 RepID=A0A371YYP6_9PROT|nr:LysR family transcriptional regulator [Komagataeibacter melaceti]
MTGYIVDYLMGNARVLEAAGRLGSFSAAAAELGMTQPAVSQQIGHIERVVGMPLFMRRHRGVALNEVGRTLVAAASEARATIRTALEQATAVSRDRVLNVLTDYGFAANWLISRLPDFEKICPGIKIQILTTQALQAQPPLGITADVSILFEAAVRKSGENRITLFEEEVYPVCSPAYARTHGPFTTLADLGRAHLLHLNGHENLWFTWTDWFARMDPDPSVRGSQQTARFRAFGNYPLLLQSAMQGEGIALGWRPLVDTCLESGVLVKVWQKPLRSRRGYVLTAHTPRSSQAELFCDWLVNLSRMSI